MIATNRLRFSPGRVLATPGVLEAFAKVGQTPDEFLARHLAGDWGDVCPDDAALNDEALQDGTRLLSSYKLKDGTTKIWIITEAADDEGHRCCTTVLLPNDY